MKRAQRAAPQPSLDVILFFTTLLLVLLGALMVFSSSVIMADVRWKTPYLFVTKHVLWVAVGMTALFFFSRYDYRKLQKWAKPLIIAAVVLLVAVLVVGTVVGGARRWLRLGPLNLQPSEFAKLVLIIALADFLDRRKSKLTKFSGLVPALVIMGLLCGLVALEPDLGTPAIMAVVGLSLLYTAGARPVHLAGLIAAGIPLVIEEIIRKPYRLKRIKDFIASWWDMGSLSYQLNQSILALGNGGILGRGLGQSQMKLSYLPEAHTDFIFPIIGEELGFAGTLFLITLFVLFGWRGIHISRKSSDYFGSLLALGITWHVLFQAVVNMGVACGVFPTKGLPLPFVSYGGTALLINCAEVGILLSIARRSRA